MNIKSILVRKLTAGDLFNMERTTEQGPDGGGGQSYIDIPLGDIGFGGLASFLSVNIDEIKNGDNIIISARPIGEGSLSDLTFSSRGTANQTRYRIANQNRHQTNTQRHDGWGAINDFPSIPATISSARGIAQELWENVRLYIVKTVDDKFYCGYIDSNTTPEGWPDSIAISSIFEDSACKIINLFEFDNPIISNIFSSWKTKPNVLLYGSPGTGKTHVMNKLWSAFNGESVLESISINSTDRINPFSYNETPLPFDLPIKTKWLTFHQNYTYENFIISMKPIPSESSFFLLKPYAGALLDSAINVHNSDAVAPSTAILFIDELNRGNVSRIFGEFITFMEFSYREGADGAPIPVPLSGVERNGERTEEIVLEDGTAVRLPVPWFFPKHIYILASMNSIDKAVAPLDSALLRRMHKINIFPSMDSLAVHLNITDFNRLLSPMEEEDMFALSPEEIAWLLLYRINYQISASLGKEYELGQSYMYPITDGEDVIEKYKILAKIWDESIYPQIQERFANRKKEMLQILRIDNHSQAPDNYLFGFKQAPMGVPEEGGDSSRILNDILISRAFIDSQDSAISTLRFLAGVPT